MHQYGDYSHLFSFLNLKNLLPHKRGSLICEPTFIDEIRAKLQDRIEFRKQGQLKKLGQSTLQEANQRSVPLTTGNKSVPVFFCSLNLYKQRFPYMNRWICSSEKKRPSVYHCPEVYYLSYNFCSRTTVLCLRFPYETFLALYIL